jgi:hypothetical protein
LASRTGNKSFKIGPSIIGYHHFYKKYFEELLEACIMYFFSIEFCTEQIRSSKANSLSAGQDIPSFTEPKVYSLPSSQEATTHPHSKQNETSPHITTIYIYYSF